MKKLMASCAALLLVFSNTALVPAIAADDTGAVISVSDAETEIGGTFTVDVTLKDNPGIIGWHIYVNYDSDAFELTNCKDGRFTKDEAAEKDVVETGIATGPLDNMPFSMSWSDSIHGNYNSDGVLATLTFNVKENAEPGDYTIELEQNPEEFYKAGEKPGDFINQNYTLKVGTVTVKEPVVDVTGVTVSPDKIEFKKAGETQTIVPTVLPEKATNKKVKYTSSDSNVATVDESGVVTAVGEGSAEITVTTEDGEYTAKCSVTVAHEHKMNKVDAKDSTCTEQGNNEYFFCEGCKKYFKDEQGTTETTPDAEKRDLKAHDLTKENTDAKYLKSKATCVSKAVYYYSCADCGAVGTETFEYGEVDKTNHVGETEIKGEKKATCDADGYTGDTVCKSCNEIVTKGEVITAEGHKPSADWKHDETSHWKECTVGCGTIIDKADHKGGEATCIKKAVCEVCGTEYGEVDPENHIGETEIRDYKAPTVDEEGYSGDTYCLDCGAKIAEGKVLPKHVHTIEKIEAKEATHFAPGNIEYYKCSECGMLFKDEAGTEALTIEQTVIEQIPHSFGDAWFTDENGHWKECECGETDSADEHTFGEWEVTAEPTEDAEGTEERVCEVCGYAESRTVDKLGGNEDTDNGETDEDSDAPGNTEQPGNTDSDDNKAPVNGNDTNDNSNNDGANNNSGADNTGNSGDNAANNNGTGNAGGDNPNTGAAASAATLGVLALGALVAAKKKK